MKKRLQQEWQNFKQDVGSARKDGRYVLTTILSMVVLTIFVAPAYVVGFTQALLGIGYTQK